MKRSLVVLIILASICIFSISAQAAEVTLLVTVTTEEDAALENAVVVITPCCLGGPQTDVTDFGGQCEFVLTTEGELECVVAVTLDGYVDFEHSYTLEGQDVTLGATIQLIEEEPFLGLPGFEMVVFILSLIVAIFLLKFNKKGHN